MITVMILDELPEWMGWIAGRVGVFYKKPKMEK